MMKEKMQRMKQAMDKMKECMADMEKMMGEMMDGHPKKSTADAMYGQSMKKEG